MRALSFLIVSLGVCAVVRARAATIKPADFPQVTRVEGKAPVNLGGTWLLYAQAQFAGGQSRALQPQIISSARGSDGTIGLKVLDVQLPKSIYEPYQAANRKSQAWEPTPKDVDLLRKEWAKLPPATEKDWRKSEMVYDRVDFTVASPDKYDQVFADQTGDIRQALEGSLFALMAIEKYRPQSIPKGENVAQVMERKSIYVVRKVSDSVIEGTQFTGYVAAGPGVPLPISLHGPFRLYRLAKGQGGAPSTAPKRPARRHGQQ
jgi:hypothetical protein